jgi:hypothetical protein
MIDPHPRPLSRFWERSDISGAAHLAMSFRPECDVVVAD